MVGPLDVLADFVRRNPEESLAHVQPKAEVVTSFCPWAVRAFLACHEVSPLSADLILPDAIEPYQATAFNTVVRKAEPDEKKKTCPTLGWLTFGKVYKKWGNVVI